MVTSAIIFIIRPSVGVSDSNVHKIMSFLKKSLQYIGVVGDVTVQPNFYQRPPDFRNSTEVEVY